MKKFILSTIFNETITPWILGTLVILAASTLAATVIAWRDMKRSPYFFMRQQAEQRLQTYSLVSLGFTLAIAVTAVYAWQAPTDNIARVAVLPNEKPPTAEIQAVVAGLPQRQTAINSLDDVEAAADNIAADTMTLSETPLFTPPTLPTQYNQFTPQADLNNATDIGELFFSTEITAEYQPINPASLFAEGYFTLFATFSYEAMADGMEWAWVWRLNGDVVEGGNEIWQYGDEGPGYIFFAPEEGFQRGEYTLEVWVNEELLSQSSVIMNTAAVAAGN